MFDAAAKGNIPKKAVEEFAKATPHGKTLPEHIKSEYPKLHKFMKKKVTDGK